MLLTSRQRVSPIDFEAFVRLPAHLDRTFELIDGEIVEVPSNPYASKLAGRIFGELYIYLKTHDLGHLTGEAGGYVVNGERYAPDVAFISYARQPQLAAQGYNPNPPELAVEVLSDPASPEEGRRLRLKLSSYLAAGVVVWVVNAQTRRVEVHQPGQAARELDEGDVLMAEGILPPLTLLLSVESG